MKFNFIEHGFKHDETGKPYEPLKTGHTFAGTPCETLSIEELVSTDRLNTHRYCFNGQILQTTFSEANINPKTVKDYLPAIQIFDSGYRWGKDYSDWNFWNGAVILDIDSKKYPEPFNIQDLEDNLYASLNARIPNNFYFIQKSASGTSLHIVFYFKDLPEKSEKLFKYLADRLVVFIVRLMTELNYGELAKTDGVIDPCSDRPAQLCYMSNYPIRFGCLHDNEIFGQIQDGLDMDKIHEDEKLYFEETTDLKFEFSKNQKTEFTGHIPDFIRNWSHQSRWALMKIFIKFFGPDKDKAVEHYEMIADYIASKYNETAAPKDRYTTRKLISLFSAQYLSTYKTIIDEAKKKEPNKSYVSFSAKHLEFFEIVFGVKAKIEGVDEILNYEPDEVIELSDNEFIGNYYYDIIGHIRNNQNVYIQAGCGLGKSFFFKKLFENEEKVIIVCHLNSIKDSVYAAEIANEDVVIPTNNDIKKYIETGVIPDKLLLGWNQMQLLCKSLINPYNKIDIRDHIKCFDEIHNVITTMGYRHSVIYDIIGCEKIQQKCICVTATSCGEFSIFCKDAFKYKFNKAKNYSINYYYASFDMLGGGASPNIYETINGLVRSCLDMNYDKIVIFDNLYHADLARHWGDDCLHYYKGNRNEIEVEELQRTNNLKHKILVTTTYGTEGIEIKNKINRIVFIIPLHGVTDVIVEQLINRFRNKREVDVIFIGTKDTNDTMFDKKYDALVMNIINEIQQNNPEYMKWREDENYYLSAWLYWNNTKLDNEKLDLYPKLVMLYHNYIYRYLITGHNIFSKYPDLKIGSANVFDFSEEDNFNDRPEMRLIAKYPKIVFERKTDEVCLELLEQFYIGKEYPKYELGSSDIFDENFTVKDNGRYIPYAYIRSLRMIMEFCQRIYNWSDSTPKLDFLWHPESKDYQEKLELLQIQPDFILIINLIKMFTVRNIFKYKQFKRFIKTRDKIKSETLTENQSNRLSKDITWYNKTLEKEGMTDNLAQLMSVSLGPQLEKKFGKMKNKTGTKGQRIGKAVNKKYTLIDNPFIEFSSHEECWNYATKNLLTTVNLGTWVKKSVWKNFFSKA